MAQDNPVTNEQKAGTGKSAIGLVVIAILCVAVVAVTAYILATNPELTRDIWKVIGIIVIAIVVIIAIIAVAVFVLAIPVYAFKGERYQKDVSYNVDDVESVESKDDKSGGAH